MLKNSENKSNKKQVLLIIGSVISLFILLFMLLPSIIWVVFNSPTVFFSQRVYSSKSPDRKFEIEIFRRINFPADEIVDPSITVNVSLKNSATNELINSSQFRLQEISDLETPEIIWTPAKIQIKDIDSDNRFQIEFSLSEN